MKNVEWWRGTANKMWRTYFTLKRQQEDGRDMSTISSAERKIFDICDRVLTEKFVHLDQDILRTYFTSRWGDDLYTVEDYSLKHNVPVNVIWIVIRRAMRTAMEETGLLDRKEEGKDDNTND